MGDGEFVVYLDPNGDYQVVSSGGYAKEDDAYAECQRLNALLEGAEAQANEWDKLLELTKQEVRDTNADNSMLIIKNQKMEHELARLREALRRYADHDEDCDQIFYTHRACTCGYREALAQEVEK
jgi:hypothetical protein